MQNTTRAATGTNPFICSTINKGFLFVYFHPILQPELPPTDRPAAPADKLASWSKFPVLSALLCRDTHTIVAQAKKKMKKVTEAKEK